MKTLAFLQVSARLGMRGADDALRHYQAVRKASRIVLELATDNIAPDDLPEEQARQLAALETMRKNL